MSTIAKKQICFLAIFVSTEPQVYLQGFVETKMPGASRRQLLTDLAPHPSGS
jgi:hypothetical protein